MQLVANHKAYHKASHLSVDIFNYRNIIISVISIIIVFIRNTVMGYFETFGQY